MTDSAAATAAPPATNWTAVSISGASQRSGRGRRPGRSECGDHRAGRRGRRQRSPQLDAAGGGEQLDRQHPGQPSTARRSLRAAAQPIETWSSCIAELGMESTEAGTASRFSSETMAAWVYWAII